MDVAAAQGQKEVPIDKGMSRVNNKMCETISWVKIGILWLFPEYSRAAQN